MSFIASLPRFVQHAALLSSLIFAPSCTEDGASNGNDGDAPTGGTSGAAGNATGGIPAGGSSGSAGSGATAATGGSAAGAGGTSSAGASTGGTSAAGASGSSGVGGRGAVFPPEVTRPRIMIVGDSISAGPGCYKKYLAQSLTMNGITEYEFVGEYTDDCGGGIRHSAVSCTTSANYTQPTFTVPNCNMNTYPGLATLVATHLPDLIMLQLGVNDVWSGSAPIQPILNNYATLVSQARTQNPRVVVMVAQIHKIITDNCANMASTTNAEQLVMAVPAWAASISTADSPVLVADLWTNSDAHEASDCVHPNDAGAQRMGTNWYTALAPILR